MRVIGCPEARSITITAGVGRLNVCSLRVMSAAFAISCRVTDHGYLRFFLVLLRFEGRLVLCPLFCFVHWCDFHADAEKETPWKSPVCVACTNFGDMVETGRVGLPAISTSAH